MNLCPIQIGCKVSVNPPIYETFRRLISGDLSFLIYNKVGWEGWENGEFRERWWGAGRRLWLWSMADGETAAVAPTCERRQNALREGTFHNSKGHLLQRKRTHLAARLAAFRNALATRQLQRKNLTAIYFLTAKATISGKYTYICKCEPPWPVSRDGTWLRDWRRKHSSAHADNH